MIINIHQPHSREKTAEVFKLLAKEEGDVAAEDRIAGGEAGVLLPEPWMDGFLQYGLHKKWDNPNKCDCYIDIFT